MSDEKGAVGTAHNRECAQKFVKNLGGNDRITVYRRVDSETGSVEETYILYRPACRT
jgi:hypothetical protein